MLDKSKFKNPKNTLEGHEFEEMPVVPEEMCMKCTSCEKVIFSRELEENLYVCPDCGHHFRVGARKRIQMMTDEGSFEELDEDLTSVNPLNFPGYEEKKAAARETSAEKEAVITGLAKIQGTRIAIFAMDPFFMMGSMGTVVGEKVTRLFERALSERLPVVGFTVSGGARVQEGILSLLQMAKTSGAVNRFSQTGGLYIVVLTDPTTGGVMASFAMEADYILAEPGALAGFAGPRVIEQTMRQKLPEGFQRTEFLLEKGFVDRIVDRRGQKEELANLLKLHERSSV